MFAVTSEPQTLATEAQAQWELPYPVVGDPHQEIRQICQENDWIDVYNNQNYGHLRHRSWARHPKGYYQPGVLALRRGDQILYRWRCVPNRKNMSGAGARPEAGYTWKKIKDQLKKEKHAAYDQQPVLGAKDLSWFHFLVILLAHGWFVRPRAFPLARKNDPKRVSPNKMMARVGVFVSAWLASLAFLPLKATLGAFILWLVVITPGLIEIHRQFQNVKEDSSMP